MDGDRMVDTVSFGSGWIGLAVLVVAGAAAGWYWRSLVKAKAKEVVEDVREFTDSVR